MLPAPNLTHLITCLWNLAQAAAAAATRTLGGNIGFNSIGSVVRESAGNVGHLWLWERIQHGFTYISLHAMLCGSLQGIWRSLMFPPKSFVFAIYSPPISPLSLTSFCTLLTLVSHILSHFLSQTICTFLLLFHIVVLLPEDISAISFPSFCPLIIFFKLLYQIFSPK